MLIVTPALEGLKKEWREACDCLGGSAFHYWRYIAFPVLWPSMVVRVLIFKSGDVRVDQRGSTGSEEAEKRIT